MALDPLPFVGNTEAGVGLFESELHDGHGPMPGLVLRPGTAADAQECGRICVEAFRVIATHHNFPPDFPNAEAGVEFFNFALAQPSIYIVVAEQDGRIVGSNMLWEQTPIAGVGPLTVEPGLQNGTIGRTLMAHVLDRAESRRMIGVRLVQAAYHNRSMALYTKMGFVAREPISVMQGPALGDPLRDRTVRPARENDVEACGRLHQRLHGYSRAGELKPAIAAGTAMVVERGGEISGYTTQVGYFGHTVGESDGDVMALIAAAPSFVGPGFLVPTRNTALLAWCLDRGLRLMQPETLMSRGFYREPAGAYLPSILF